MPITRKREKLYLVLTGEAKYEMLGPSEPPCTLKC